MRQPRVIMHVDDRVARARETIRKRLRGRAFTSIGVRLCRFFSGPARTDLY
jgi:hypothetical protein